MESGGGPLEVYFSVSAASGEQDQGVNLSPSIP